MQVKTALNLKEKGQERLLEGCPLCGRKGDKPLFEREGKSFFRCVPCGLIYQDPPPEPRESQEYYQRGYYEGFGEQVRAIQKGRLALYEEFLSECDRYRQGGRLLDVGSGYGDFLKSAHQKGWEVWGIEPSRAASESSQKFLNSRVFNQTIEGVDFPKDHFDVITLWNVIDCLPNPVEAMRKIQVWLRPGGLLVIRTPNVFFHWGLYRVWQAFPPFWEKLGWKKEASVFLRTNFGAPSLRRLFREAGFSRIRIQSGIPTRGDAYQVFSHSNLMEGAKFLLYSAARLVDFLSTHQILMGSNLLVRASKEAGKRSQFLSVASRNRMVVKKILLHLLAILGYLLGLPLWFRLLGKDREIRVLLYHSVSSSWRSEVSVRESEFTKQLDFLKAHYSVIPLEEAVGHVKTGSLPLGRCVAITFDDGYRDNYEIVHPILKEKALPATVFFLTGGEGRERSLPHLPEESAQGNRLLTWDEAREMSASGVTFGSHGQAHVRLVDLSPNEARLELSLSKKEIESQIGKPVLFFSYPYGTILDRDQRTEFFVREAGYEAGFSAIFGTNGRKTNLFALKRIGIEASDSLFTFRAKLNGALGLLHLFDTRPVRKLIRWFDSVFFRSFPRLPAKKPPLLLVSVDFPPHTDGVSTISRELSRRVAQEREEVIVIGPRDRGDHAFDAREPYRVFRVPGYEWGYLRLIPILMAMPWVVWRCGIRKVFAMNIAYGGILSWILSYFSSLEYLLFAYGYEFEKVKKNPFIRLVYQNIYRRAKKIVACSQLVKERLILFGVEPEKIEVLYPAVDLERYRPLEVPRGYLERKRLSGRKLILTVGRIIQRKGHDRVLQALPKIFQSCPNVLYGIVGIGDHEKPLRKEVQRLNLTDHVRFFGKVPEEELVWLYNACELFVMPSREISEGGHLEGFGIVYLEANACAKPVIGGRSGGIVEAIRDGETGFLVDPNRPDEVAEKIIFLLSHPEKAEALGREGWRWVREAFDWDRYVERAFEFLYGSLLS